jgi:23S rRNA (guanine2445-N2)-methyltransferase / 23S rRNA (guanine2069-N7)-methyltransferase
MSIQPSTPLNLFATTPKGLELLLVDELRQLGATRAAEKLAGVEFTGDLAFAYKACLWSRLANRILLRLANVRAETPEALYAGVQSIAWDEHMDPDATLAVNFVSSQSQITHTLFGAQKVKDAIVDQMREKFNTRPNVEREHPDVSINVYLYRDVATISLDLSGDSLHRRNYRLGGGGVAPLKENLAAAILIRSGWPAIAKTGGMLLDPMSGSGTLLIEGAMIAGDIAPGLAREYFGFLRWKKHQPTVWKALVEDATTRREQGVLSLPPIVGYDADPYAVRIAFENIERAGLLGKIHVEKRDLSLLAVKEDIRPGLIVVNPPYGERIGEEVELHRLYALLGEKFKTVCTGWSGAVFTGNPELAKQMGIRARKYYALFNGAIPCQLLLFDINVEKFLDRSPAAQNERRIAAAQRTLESQDKSAVEMFANRLRKNVKHLKRWAERENISCYRIYDADLPEYAFAIDRYEQFIYVQEYPAPKSIDADKALQRQQEVLAVLPDVLGVPAGQIFFHVKPRRPVVIDESAVANIERFYPVAEGQAKFLVNLYQPGIETGLKLQQRSLRAMVQSMAEGTHFLNLFAASGAMTVSAAAGGALTTKTVAKSAFDFNWTKQNLALNAIDAKQNQVITTDPFMWFDRERERYHLIFADVPEVEDYGLVLYQILKLLSPEGVLLLAVQDHRFKLDPQLFPDFKIEEITQHVVAADFTRQVKTQRCWKIS